jgi:hypothetical protein
LSAAHDGDAAVGPHEEETRVVRATAHAVVARAIRATNKNGDFGNVRRGDGGDEFGAVLGDTAFFVSLSDHETSDVLEEEERNAALRAQLDEVSSLQG